MTVSKTVSAPKPVMKLKPKSSRPMKLKRGVLRHDVREIEEVIIDENSQHSDGSNGSRGNISSLSQPINDSSSSTSLSSVADNV